MGADLRGRRRRRRFRTRAHRAYRGDRTAGAGIHQAGSRCDLVESTLGLTKTRADRGVFLLQRGDATGAIALDRLHGLVESRILGAERRDITLGGRQLRRDIAQARRTGLRFLAGLLGLAQAGAVIPQRRDLAGQLLVGRRQRGNLAPECRHGLVLGAEPGVVSLQCFNLSRQGLHLRLQLLVGRGKIVHVGLLDLADSFGGGQPVAQRGKVSLAAVGLLLELRQLGLEVRLVADEPVVQPGELGHGRALLVGGVIGFGELGLQRGEFGLRTLGLAAR